MECRLPFLDMRSPPHVLRGLLAPLLCPIPTSSLLPRNKPQTFSRLLFLSIRFRSSSSCTAVKVDELSKPFVGSVLCDSVKLQLNPHDRFRKTPREIISLVRSSAIVEGDEMKGSSKLGIVHSDRKRRLKWYSEMLRNCTLNRDVNEGKEIHRQIVEDGIEPDSHLWVSLINFYAKCGCLNDARLVFDDMPERDVVSWTALIAGFVAQGYSGEIASLFCEMLKDGIRPNEFTLATVVKACSVCLDAEFGKQLHGINLKVGFFSDIYVGSALVDLYSKCGEVEYAEKVFFFMPQQNDVSWNALLNGYAQAGDGEGVLRLFCKMTEKEMKYNKFTLSTLLKGCANSRDVKAGEFVHSMAIKLGSDSDEFVSCSLVHLYSKFGLVDDAFKIFLRIMNPDIVTWSAMISCLDQQGRKQKAAGLFCSMICLGLRPNQFALASTVNAAKDLDDPLYCGSIHACVYKYGFGTENVVGNALLAMYMKIGSVQDGFKVFDTMTHRDIVSWNALLSGLHDSENSYQGPRIFKHMLQQGFKPNMYTLISILRSCSNHSNLGFGKQVHAQIIKDKLDGDGYMGTALIDMYAKCKCLEDVEVVFNRLNERDVFTWTVMVASCAQTDQGEKAVHCFSQMQKAGVKPNEYTLASCLRGCSGIASIESGRQLHSLSIKSGHFGDTFVASALVDMYGKCGYIDDAENIFKAMSSYDRVLWNTIICQYSQHGQREKALEAFENMLDDGVSPDEVTFIGILSSCSHMGLIEVGKQHFNSMSEVYGITPCIEHYACMVDILGRAGKFSEAENFIELMKLTQNSLIWETLLGACKIHGNVELGQRAAEKLILLEPEIDSHYISLSNIFAAKGMWDEVLRVRALMSSQGVKKEPGCSWVEADARTHVFLSQDTSHPMIQDIHQKLEELGQKLSSVGYVPDTNYVLLNVSDREKKENLSYHSEKLALAFSLINNISNKPIRIFKNLRICGDCHNYMKLVSCITNRSLIIRDVNRFHHFRDGTCSCQDYW